MVVATASVKVLTGRGDVGLDSRVSVEPTNTVRTRAQVKGLGGDITISKDCKDTEDNSKI